MERESKLIAKKEEQPVNFFDSFQRERENIPEGNRFGFKASSDLGK